MSISTNMKLESLPDKNFIECFEYLNGPDIFHSFGQLNYRFHILIRKVPLYVNFHQFKKSLFNNFCQIISSNPEIKQNIISLKLSNEGTRGQIESFLSLFSLNEFIHLRSLSLINLKDNDTEELLLMLPFLSNLYYFSIVGSEYKIQEIVKGVSKSNIQILTVPQFDFNSTSVLETMSVTSLTIFNCDMSDLCQLFKHTPTLKYLKIHHFNGSQIFIDDELNFIDTPVVYLKQLIINYSSAKFKVLELLLQHMPNLEIFSIFVPDKMEMVDADLWKNVITTSLPHLRIFKFNFGYYAIANISDRYDKLRQGCGEEKKMGGAREFFSKF